MGTKTKKPTGIVGTCSVCERPIKLDNKTKGVVSRHGYKRHGQGQGESGHCWGGNYLAWELSKIGGERRLEGLIGHVLPDHLKRIEAIKAGEPEGFRSFSGRLVTKEEPEAYERLRAKAQASAENYAEILRSEIKRLEKRIATWVFKPLEGYSEETGK